MAAGIGSGCTKHAVEEASVRCLGLLCGLVIVIERQRVMHLGVSTPSIDVNKGCTTVSIETLGERLLGFLNEADGRFGCG